MSPAQKPILDWHAHVYFDADQLDEARRLCEAMRAALATPMGRLHLAPVGPHPRGSCQMTVARETLAAAIEWLITRRGRLTVFMHGNSGDDLVDHTAHVLWLGPSEALNLSVFS